MMKRNRYPCWSWGALAALTLTALGCGRAGTAPEDPAASASRPTEAGEKTFTFEGVVEVVEPEDGVVHIDHEAIPGLMEAMVMPFEPADPSLLEDVYPGDEVEGTLQVELDGEGRIVAMELADLLVLKPAPPPEPESGEITIVGDTEMFREPRPELEPGAPVPDFTLTDQNGETFKLSDLRGQYTLITFIYTRCPVADFCPLMDRRFGQLAERLGRSSERAERVRLLSVSFDPEHDTPQALAEHARRVGARPPLWTFAVAEHDELFKIAEPLGLKYAPRSNDILHNLSTSLIGPDGALIQRWKGNDWTASELYGAIREALSDERDEAEATES